MNTEIEYDMFLGGYRRRRPARRLKNLDISEVSFVDRPATGKTFLFFKRGDNHDIEGELGELVSRINGLDIADEDKAHLLEVVENLSEDDMEGISELVNRLSEETLKASLGNAHVEKVFDPWPSLSASGEGIEVTNNQNN